MLDENGKQLQPEDFHFRAGVRQKLDIEFLRAMATRPPEIIKSDFIKQAVVEWYESKQKREEDISEAEKVKRELEVQIRRLREMIRSGAGVVIETAAACEGEKRKFEADEAKAREAEEKVKALTDVFD